MKFSSSGLGRKNGFYFKVDYEFYQDGEKAIQPWTVSVERRDAEGRVSNFVRLHRTHRFESMECAQQFCEDIADGKYSIEELRKEEDAAVAAHNAAIETANLAKLSAFLQDFKSIGVDPMLLPAILQKVYANGLGDPCARQQSRKDPSVSAVGTEGISFRSDLPRCCPAGFPVPCSARSIPHQP